jgi:hypothetical protein
VEGALNQDSWFVFDFVELKRIMKRLCDEIDHLVLLPLTSDRIGVVEQGDTVSVSVDGKPRMASPATSFRARTVRCCRSRTPPSRCWPRC